MSTDFAAVRAQFPALSQKAYGHDLVYLDSAATTLKPKSVVERIANYYLYESANVHRGAHYLADQGTRAFEAARQATAKFIGAKADELVFVRNTTEAVNLAAYSWAATHLKKGDRILITEMEHHANFVPWQLVAEKNGFSIDAVRVGEDGRLDAADLERKLQPPVKLFAVTGCSNSLGTFNDVKALALKAHAIGAKVLVDAAQLVTQKKVDVRDLDADFLAFSGHKIFGPTGIGVLYAKKELLEQMPPWQGGGSMISKVTLEKTTYNEAPFRFEAGTPHIEGVIGLHAAIEFFEKIGVENAAAYEHGLLVKATNGLKAISGVKIYADLPEKGAILSFNLEGAHHSDVSQILDQQGVAVRAGHHCTQPLMARLGISGTVRASFSVYNNESDVDALIAAVKKARELLV